MQPLRRSRTKKAAAVVLLQPFVKQAAAAGDDEGAAIDAIQSNKSSAATGCVGAGGVSRHCALYISSSRHRLPTVFTPNTSSCTVAATSPAMCLLPNVKYLHVHQASG